MKKVIFLLLITSKIFAQNGSFYVNTIGSNGTAFGSIQVISLKSRGIISDADLSFSSTSFGSNQTNAIQSILNNASASNPLYIIWDAAVSNTGLKIKSNTHIFALPNCGAILRDSANNFLFSNNEWVGSNNDIIDSNITIEGGIWNGNGFRGGTGKQLHSNSEKGLITILNFSGVKNLSIINATLLNSRTYGGLFMTTENLLMDGVILNQGVSPVINQDGFDFIGSLVNATIKNCRIRCGDDRLAFGCNAAGGVFIDEHHEPYNDVNGDQHHIRIDNIYFDGPGKGIELYVAGANTIHDLYASNITGTAITQWFGCFNKDMFSGGSVIIDTGSNIPYNLTFENISVEVTSQAVYDPGGYALAMFQCSAKNVTFRNITRTDQTYNKETFGIYKRTSTPVVLTNIRIENYKTYNASPGNAINQIYVHDATVNNLTIDGCTVDLGSSTQNAAFLNVGSNCTVSSLTATNNYINGLKYVVNNSGTITTANITNITHTGQGGSDPTINTSGTFTKLIMNGWIGVAATSGTIGTTSNGNPF